MTKASRTAAIFCCWLRGSRDAASNKLPNASFEEFSLDEVGLWYELTVKGRSEWKQSVDDEELTQYRRWTLDDLSDTQTLIIQAKSIDVAEVILRWWLSHNTAVELVGNTKSIEPVSAFMLRDGTVVTNGVKISFRYQKPASSSL